MAKYIVETYYTCTFKVKHYLDDISNNQLDQLDKRDDGDFEILDVKKVVWKKRSFSNNLSRFYGKKLPDKSFKEKHCGNGPFISIVVKQDNPIYEERKTSKGKALVNSLLYDKKQLYREWTGGGHKIHTSNDMMEADHDIFFLFNKKSSDYLNNDSWDNQIKEYQTNIRGFDGWENLDDMFSFVNESSEYVVLRNYEEIDAMDENKSDIDFLTIDIDFSYHINGIKKHKNKFRSAYSVKIDSKYYSADIRCLGDGYYDIKWIKDIVKNRILYKNRFFIPCPEDEFFSLLYHSLIHKNKMSDKYLKKLISLIEKNNLNHDVDLLKTRGGSFELLARYMKSKGYKIIRPIDYSVQFNYKNKGVKRWIWEFIGHFRNAK